jgi:lysyl-tRNA synthetase class 2
VPTWEPSAQIADLRSRGSLLSEIRGFFETRGVLEVDTPILASHAITDPNIELFAVPTGDSERFLQSSPEYAMKRLLASGSGDIYQLGKVFRYGEHGKKHNPEFVMLEWYRVGWTHYQLIREVAELLIIHLPVSSWQVWPLPALFEHFLGLDPREASAEQLHDASITAGINLNGTLEKLDYIDLLMTHIIEPQITDWGLVFVTDFLAEQSALSRVIDRTGKPVAARFEAYFQGVELANGYWEECCPVTLSERFNEDNKKRLARGQVLRVPDPQLLHALESGLPDCAGVALGFDRLLMLTLGRDRMSQVLPFDWMNA